MDTRAREAQLPPVRRSSATVMVIDVYASQPNYWRHLAPVVDELRARGHEVRTWASISGRPWGARLMHTPASDLMVVASWVDARRWAHLRCAYLEHGAGQTYLGNRPSGYAGAPQLEHVVLFLGPNERIAERWLSQYPRAMVATVGCPALDVHLTDRASIDVMGDIASAAATVEPEPANAVSNHEADQDADPEADRSDVDHHGGEHLPVAPTEQPHDTAHDDDDAGDSDEGDVDRGCEHDRIVDPIAELHVDALAVALGRDARHRDGATIDRHADNGLRPRGVPVVAVTHHWWCGVCPETVPALPAYEAPLAALCADPGLRVVGHAHPRAQRRTERFWRRLSVAYEPDPDHVLREASLVVADNTSLMYEAAALDIPVLAVNAPTYRRDVEHGLRFWSHVPGLQVDEPADLVGKILRALKDPPEAKALRAHATAHVYAHLDGSSSARAADAIEKVL